jgi:hypothetical protein
MAHHCSHEHSIVGLAAQGRLIRENIVVGLPHDNVTAVPEIAGKRSIAGVRRERLYKRVSVIEGTEYVDSAVPWFLMPGAVRVYAIVAYA